MVIQFGVKEHIKMAETYQWAEEELAKQRKRELELLEDSRRYWQGETADAFRQGHEFMLMEGEYAAYMKHVRGMKEVMEESIPRFRWLQQMVVELPTAYGLPCDDEAPETLRLDEEALAVFHEMTDEILRKNRYVCDELTRIMDGCDGLVDFSAERRELEELREDMCQMEVFKRNLDEYADEMRRMDNWMVERLSGFVIKTDGKTNKALLSKGSVNENCIRSEEDNEEEEENTEPTEVIDMRVVFEPVFTEGQEILTQCLIDHDITGQNEIDRVLEWTMENEAMLLWDLNRAYRSGNDNGQDVDVIYETIMGKYNEQAWRYFLEYVKEAEYDGCYDWGEVAYILQNYRPEILRDLYESQSAEEKELIFGSILKIYNDYRIEQGAIILSNYIEGNSDLLADELTPELTVALFRVLEPHRLMSIYGIKDSSAQREYCEYLIHISNMFDSYQMFYANTWLQVNNIESFTDNNDNQNFDYLIDEFVRIYNDNIVIYNEIAEDVGLPPAVIAVIHYRENSINFFAEEFNIDITNGSNLEESISQDNFLDRTRNVIQTQQEKISGLNLTVETTDIISMLCFTEMYNGWGYYDNHLISPYSYSGTNIYESGKFISDGTYDPNVIDKQIGAYRLLLATVAGIYEVEEAREYVNEMCVGVLK